MSNPRIPFQISGASGHLPKLNGRSLLVHVALNVEHWPFERAMPRTVLPPPHGKAVSPDVPNFSWVEYGLRAGMPRILDMMRARGLTGGALLNASVVQTYPQLAELLLADGWEFVGHGLTQRALSLEPDEEAIIAQSLQILRDFSGQKVRAWLGPGLAETTETPEALKRNGIDCVHDWALDDVPHWMTTSHGPMIALPYSLDMNDVPIYAIGNEPSSAMYDRLADTLAQFDAEGSSAVRVLTLALHPHLIGVPHRALYFGRMLDLLLARDDVVFVNSSQMAGWFSAARPQPGTSA
ncbi:polysaccharide deacetylase family protein [Roseinatronobacter sp.]|uniref:polysaccharide deacetylase family protein n=1 Tax=Roseinatronobacter sp. TaxID=1945755 RepID=UPI0025D98188|nr:polysaccharide deacetylase family protein [Roseibaca sp.]